MVNVCRLPDKLHCQTHGNLHWGVLKKNHKLKCAKEVWRDNIKKHFRKIVYKFCMTQHLYR